MRIYLPKSSRLPLAICLGFFCLQLSYISYGTWINDLPHLSQTVQPESLRSTLLNDAIVNQNNQLAENPNTWLTRYKLYAVTADEMVNLMALSRLNPRQGQLDPHFYMYGGAYLYLLAAWYGFGHLIGLLPLPTLDQLLASPDLVDLLYIWGRLFVLLVFTTSAWIMHQTFRLLFTKTTSLSLLIIYLLVPASLIFSITMKPHWYALLPAAISLYLITYLFTHSKRPPWHLPVLSLSLGLAVASTSSYALFAVIIYAILIYAYKKSLLPLSSLFYIPAGAIIVFIITNPFIFLNYSAYQQESAALWSWYSLQATPLDFLNFVKNSLVAGFGLVGLFALAAASTRPRLGAPIIFIILFAAIVTSSVSYWNNAYRFIPFFLPLALLLIGHAFTPRYLTILALLTTTLAIPTITAYYDEDSPTYSTRYQAAAWINQNIPEQSTICAQMVPYNSAPFDFTRLQVTPDCQYQIEIHPHTTTNPPPNIIAQFIPRLYSRLFPLVHGEVQPRVYITKSP